jgi:hypothetical protein
MLIRQLKIPPAHALGHLEMMWLNAHMDQRPDYANAAELEAAAMWTGKPGAFALAAVAARLVDKSGRSTLTVHDYWDHAPHYVVQRYRRAEAAAENNGAQRRTKSASVRPTDPDPDPLTPRRRDHNPDLDQDRGQNRNRQYSQPREAENAQNVKNRPARMPQIDFQTLIAGVSGPPPPPDAPAATQPIGTYTARECASAAAALERTHDRATAFAMWSCRAAEMSEHRGGLEQMRDYLSELHAAQIPGNPKGVGKIHSPAKWLNKQTGDWLATRRSAR